MKYAASTNGFYLHGLHAVIPVDAVDISDDEHAALLAGQATGQRIVAGAGGRPTLIDAPAPSDDDLAAIARSRRDALLARTDWTQVRDVPEATALRWIGYRDALRDVPEQSGFPRAIDWPVAPA